MKATELGGLEGDRKTFTWREVAEMLVGRNALAELRLADAEIIVRAMSARRVRADTVLVQEGFDNTSFMALVLQGSGVVENEFARKGDSLLLTLIGPGSLVGELGLVDGLPRSATVRTTSDMVVAVLERDALAQLMERHPAQAARLLSAMLAKVSNRLRATTQKLRALHQVNRAMQQEIDVLLRASGRPPAPPRPDLEI